MAGGRYSSGVMQQPEPLQRQTGAELAAEPGERDRQQQADDRRRHPEEQGGGDHEGRDAGERAEHRVRAVAADDVLEGDRAVVAALRLPAGVAPEQDLEHRARLDQHQDRREERGEDDLDHGRDDRAGSPPPEARRSSPSNQHQQQAEELRREQDAHGEREQRQRALGVEARPDRDRAGSRG